MTKYWTPRHKQLEFLFYEVLGNLEVRSHGIASCSFVFLPDSECCLTVKFCYFQTVFKSSFPVSVWSKEVKKKLESTEILLNHRSDCHCVLFVLQNT